MINVAHQSVIIATFRGKPTKAGSYGVIGHMWILITWCHSASFVGSNWTTHTEDRTCKVGMKEIPKDPKSTGWNVLWKKQKILPCVPNRGVITVVDLGFWKGGQVPVCTWSLYLVKCNKLRKARLLGGCGHASPGKCLISDLLRSSAALRTGSSASEAILWQNLN